MKESIYKSYDELPLFLNAVTVAKVLGLCAGEISVYSYLLYLENRKTF